MSIECPRCGGSDNAKAGRPRGVQRWLCGGCGRHWIEQPITDRRRPGLAIGATYTDSRGRQMVHLGCGHPYANSGGWQYVYRHVVMVALGRVLRSDEHVHHIDGDVTNNDLSNLEVVAASYHGAYHASGVSVARGRDGRFRELEEWEGEFGLPRWGSIIGRAADEARRSLPVLAEWESTKSPIPLSEGTAPKGSPAYTAGGSVLWAYPMSI